MIENIQILSTEILSDRWSILKDINYQYQKDGSSPQTQSRVVYDRGDGAAILLYSRSRNTVILTRQFRLPTYINGNASGMLLEVCAGMLDNDNPETCIRRETEEETGYRLKGVKKAFETYMSPGSMTEILHCFVAEYDLSMKVSAGGGLKEEEENIEVLEMDVEEVMELLVAGEIRDAKTIMLLQYARLNQLI
ncbi:MAG: NUDIX domain-containing protein [Saprospiraceae bacterium]